MGAPARIRLLEEPKEKRLRRPRRPRVTYTVEFEQSRDPQRGEELLLRWLAEVLSE